MFYDIVLYDENNEVFAIEHSIDEDQWKDFADELYAEGGYTVKVFNSNGSLVYTLGI